MKYGGSSPSAVPIPHRTASNSTWGKMLVSGTREPCNDENSGGPNAVQFLSSHEGPLCGWIVSYKDLFISTRPHCTALIVNSAICEPKYRTNVCKPDPAYKEGFKFSIKILIITLLWSNESGHVRFFFFYLNKKKKLQIAWECLFTWSETEQR